jgi:signal transduction histidine kinase
LDRSTIHVHDQQASDVSVEFPDGARQDTGIRTTVGIPLLRDGGAIGAFTVYRTEPRPFSDAEVSLLQTFADQAVIAIENARLFAGLATALDTQTATSDILRVISGSRTDVRPVFDAILESAVTLLRGFVAAISRLAGDQLELAAFTSTDSVGDAAVRSAFPQALASDGPHSRVVRERGILNVADARSDPQLPEAIRRIAVVRGYHSLVVLPMLRHDEAIGAISLTRREPGGFTGDEISLLQTFADQAVIAIENVRLFTELHEKNDALTAAHAQVTEALEQQTATSEILKAISGAQTDINPVFDTIARSAVKLCGAFACRVFRAEGEMLSVVGEAYGTADARAVFYGTHAEAVGRDSPSATAVRERRVVQYADVPNDAGVPERYRERARARGYRALMAVPMVRDQVALGTITVARREPGPFPDSHIELLKTFADQAVIAIDNVRLFNDLAAANRDLKAASQHKSEFLANMSHELRTPLNAVIGFSEVLSERMFGDVNEKQAEYLRDIHASGQHLLSLINDILDLSKIEAGRMELELTDVDLPSTLDSALTLVRERAGRRGIALTLTVDERLGRINADERKVRQVVLNLLSNAIKFTPEGGRIDVRALPVDGNVEVSVSDTGVGIAPEDQEAIFEEFKQVGMVSKKAEGTGLGLALSRKFVELHGGRMWVKSQIGAGSTFTFTIPSLAD